METIKSVFFMAKNNGIFARLVYSKTEKTVQGMNSFKISVTFLKFKINSKHKNV